MARKIAAVVFSLGCVHASSLMALGLGELTLDSFLNEPLEAKVDLLNTGSLHEDQIRIRLATTDDFKKMGIDRAYFLTGITFTVDLNDNGQARIVLTSEEPVLEPYLDFIIEARWPSGRLLREYTVLVDPPVFDESATVISASERVAAGESEAAKKKQQATSSTGTTVALGKSTLAPGEMPQRGYNADTASRPVAGSRYMIHRDDTLWEIAASARPAGASVHQTMLDIQRMNPRAFIKGNINRIKSGFIIDLPGEGDISSASNAAAQAEVRAQNQAWEEAKAAGTVYGSGPSLRISAAPEEGETATGASPEQREVGATAAAALEDLEKADLERSEMASRLQAMEQQVETLQRIVSLKDDQISALQGALSGDEDASELATADLEQAMTEDEAAVDAGLAQQVEALEGQVPMEEAADGTEGMVPDEVVETVTETEVVEEAVEVVSEPAAAVEEFVSPAAEKSGGIMSYIWYLLGAGVLAVLGFVFMRRRGDSDDDEAFPVAAASKAEDVFADVELQEQVLEVEEAPEPEAAPEEQVTEEAEPTPSTRGYGQRKNDEYASDVEASDALAEADIYIAYGRYPQAIDLLQNALVTDPENPEFRLKLLEVYVLMRDRAGAMNQMSQLESVNDAGVLARAGALIAELDGKPGADSGLGGLTDELEVASPDLMAEIEESLEADFSGLEIEDSGEEGDLDLSADFEATDLSTESLDEELVIAAESNGMSTKLDLARAYLDMGDEDGARQILEEVAAEGDAALQAEARALLDNIG